MYRLMALSLAVLPLLSLITDAGAGSRYFLQNTLSHVLFEFFFLILSFLIAGAIWHEYTASGHQSTLYLALAFLSLGLNDFIQVFFMSGTALLAFFLYLSVFSGALFFLLSALFLR